MANMAARNEELKLNALHALQRVFGTLVCLPLPEDLNDIVVGTKECPRNGVDCRNHLCTDSSDSVGSDAATLVDQDSTLSDGMLNSASPVKDKVASESVESVEAEQRLASFRMWKSTTVGECGGVRERVQELAAVITDNGGDVQQLEAELTGLSMYKTIL